MIFVTFSSKTDIFYYRDLTVSASLFNFLYRNGQERDWINRLRVRFFKSQFGFH